MVPYGFGQKVKFTKGLGPELGYLNDKIISKANKEDFKRKLAPIYQSIK